MCFICYSDGSVTEANLKTAVFSGTMRNRNCGFPVVLGGQFSKIKGSHMARQRPSTFVDKKPNSQTVLIAVFGPSLAHISPCWSSHSVNWKAQQNRQQAGVTDNQTPPPTCCIEGRGLHGNGDGGNHMESTGNPQEWAQISREYHWMELKLVGFPRVWDLLSQEIRSVHLKTWC